MSWGKTNEEILRRIKYEAIVLSDFISEFVISCELLFSYWHLFSLLRSSKSWFWFHFLTFICLNFKMLILNINFIDFICNAFGFNDYIYSSFFLSCLVVRLSFLYFFHFRQCIVSFWCNYNDFRNHRRSAWNDHCAKNEKAFTTCRSDNLCMRFNHKRTTFGWFNAPRYSWLIHGIHIGISWRSCIESQLGNRCWHFIGKIQIV